MFSFLCGSLVSNLQICNFDLESLENPGDCKGITDGEEENILMEEDTRTQMMLNLLNNLGNAN